MKSDKNHFLRDARPSEQVMTDVVGQLPLTKENVLEATEGGLKLFEHVFDCTIENKRIHGLKNPFNDKIDGHVDIYEANGQYFFAHWSLEPEISDYRGDSFKCAAFYYDLSVEKDMRQILWRINNDLQLGLGELVPSEHKTDQQSSPKSRINTLSNPSDTLRDENTGPDSTAKPIKRHSDKRLNQMTKAVVLTTQGYTNIKVAQKMNVSEGAVRSWKKTQLWSYLKSIRNS